jgi:hypothetical protein
MCAACLGACGDEPSVAFDGADLPGLVLSREEAPTGLEYLDSASGPVELEAFTMGDDEAYDAFSRIGFENGYVAVFVSPGVSDTPLGDLPPAAQTIATGVLNFPDGDAADEALEVQRSIHVPAVLDGVSEVPADGLGDGGFGVTFESDLQGNPGVVYSFRVNNALFLVAGNGTEVDPDELLEVAQSLADRARGDGM